MRVPFAHSYIGRFPIYAYYSIPRFRCNRFLYFHHIVTAYFCFYVYFANIFVDFLTFFSKPAGVFWKHSIMSE